MAFASWSEESFPSGIHPLLPSIPPALLRVTLVAFQMTTFILFFFYFFNFPSLLFHAVKSGIREVSVLGIGAAQQLFPIFRTWCCWVLLGTLQCTRRISWRCLALDLLTLSSNPIYSLCKPCGFYAPSSLLFLLYCPGGK